MQNFIRIGTGVWISISPPQTDRQTSVRPFLYRWTDRCSMERVLISLQKHKVVTSLYHIELTFGVPVRDFSKYEKLSFEIFIQINNTRRDN